MAKLKTMNVYSFAKFQTVLAALIGLLAGILYSFGGLAIDSLVSLGWLSPTSASTPGLSVGTMLAFGVLVGMPVIFAAFGFILGIIEAFLYNLFTKRFGGIELEFEQ